MNQMYLGEFEVELEEEVGEHLAEQRSAFW